MCGTAQGIKLQILFGGHISQGLVWSVIVVIVHPNPCLFPYLINVLKDEPIEGPSPKTAVEPFHKSVLGRFSRLYIFELYSMHLAPLGGELCYEFRAVVHAYALGLAPSVYQVVQDPYHPVACQGKVHFDVQRLPVVIVHDVECPETAFVLQDVGNKVHAPSMVRLRWDLQRFLYTGRQAFLRLSSQGQSQCSVDTVNALMVPWPPLRPQTVIGHPETLLRMFPGLFPKCLLYIAVIFWQRTVIIYALAHVKDTARPADAVMGKILSDASLSAGPQSFFSMISLAIWWSRAKVAYICLSLRFSSSSSLMRLSSFPLIPAYFERHL